MKNNIAQTVTVYLLWLSAIFDPIGSFYGFRYVALISVFIILMYKTILGQIDVSTETVHFKYILLFCFFLPFYGLIISLIRGGVGGDNFKDTSYFASAVYFATTLSFIQRGDISSTIRAFLFSTRILSFVIILCALAYIFTSSLDYQYYFVEHGVAYLGTRVYGGITFYYIYFVASPMLIFLLAHESWHVLEKQSVSNFICLFIVFIALFLSGTRFSMIVSVITLPVVALFKNRSSRSIFLTCILILLVSVIAYGNYGDAIMDMLSLEEGSNNAKLSYLENYYSLFNDPITFIFGQGFNAHEWSYEFSNLIIGEASKTELTYLELIRVFGLIGASVFIFFMFYFFTFTKRVLPEYRWIFVGLALYLLVSSSNPYVFSSNGMLVIGLSACIVSLPCKSKIVKTDLNKAISMDVKVA
ncbi:MAG: O-antigen ligase family protein [Chlorobium sp.]|nr:O-antigen ligase family protein [Chlorobium sp.]